ncbi:unnamed protein product [Effrenium voratum]|nr:unnamed protein product [Effrenium voratum]|mmetsp:Transcript_26472/g.63171  ORF Transcript_26472/g.63171 Transcript_26472/m.63171 type:complete len:211 (+) Transcript_26472:74-706(+)
MTALFPWCCKPWTAEKASADSATEYVRSLPLSSSGHFPVFSVQERYPEDVQAPSHSRTLEPCRAGMAARSMAPNADVLEKARLQRAVKNFAQVVTQGMAVELLDEDTGALIEATLVMDRCLRLITLKLPNEERRYAMQDMIAIFRDKEFTSLVPSLSHLAPRCLAVDFSKDENFRLCFQFQDSEGRDNFYSCLKILRMSLDTAAPPDDDA